ncbi:lectin protein [Gracilaria domingensis]|nr:lectin protein [Gracilaria domingensis]
MGSAAVMRFGGGGGGGDGGLGLGAERGRVGPRKREAAAAPAEMGNSGRRVVRGQRNADHARPAEQRAHSARAYTAVPLVVPHSFGWRPHHFHVAGTATGAAAPMDVLFDARKGRLSSSPSS